MTIETRTSIELSDITALEFECKDCHTRIMFPVAGFKDPPIYCSVCFEKSKKQWMVLGNQDFRDIHTLGHIIQLFSGMNKPDGFVMRLHITNPFASREAV